MPDVLILTRLPVMAITALREGNIVAYAPDSEQRVAVFDDPARLETIEAVVTSGRVGLSAAQMDSLPALRLIATIGLGREALDGEHAKRRGVVVTDGRGTLEEGVADHALALLLALARNIPAHDLALKTGAEIPARLPASVSGKRLGILGLGEIGRRIAHRGQAFGMAVAYHNRHRRDDVAYRYLPSPRGLAAASDFLVVAAPGGKETRHLVDAGVLAALGPEGRLINVGRGSIVDTVALVEALETGGIAGAALDVFEGEPNPPAWLAAASNLILTPHQAARSSEREQALTARLLETLASLGRAPSLQEARS